MLCGSMVGLPIWRHRYFEMHPPVYPMLNSCNHKLGQIEWMGEKVDVPVYISAGGDSVHGKRPSRLSVRWRPRQLFALKCSAMGIDWIPTRHELSESIPPAYTEYIGGFLMKAVLASKLLAPDCKPDKNVSQNDLSTYSAHRKDAPLGSGSLPNFELGEYRHDGD